MRIGFRSLSGFYHWQRYEPARLKCGLMFGSMSARARARALDPGLATSKLPSGRPSTLPPLRGARGDLEDTRIFGSSAKVADVGMLTMRVVTALMLVHHGEDKLLNTEAFTTNIIAAYFSFLPGPPVFWTYLSAAFEILGSLCITIGVFTRPAALLVAGTMANAIVFHLMKFGLQNFPFNPEKGGAYTYEPSLLILGCSTCIMPCYLTYFK